MKRWFLYALLVLSAPAPAEVYRWVDEQGNVVFSDQPRPGAERLELPEITTYEAPAYDPSVLQESTGAPAGPVGHELRFLQPAPNETVRDNQGNVRIRLHVQPPLRPGERIALQLDEGARVIEIVEPQYVFTGLDRGTHSVQAWVVNAEGGQVSEPVQTVFHLHQASRLFEPPPPDGDNGDNGDADGPPSGPVRQAPRAPMAPRFQYNPTQNNAGG